MATDRAVSGKEAVRALKKLGFLLDRVEGSHHMLIAPGHPHTIAVPIPGSKALRRWTLAGIIRMAQVTRKQFFDAIR